MPQSPFNAGWVIPSFDTAPIPVKRVRKKVLRDKIYNLPIIEAFPHMLKSKACDGEIGIEIECEGTHLFNAPISYWRVEKDGSLRVVDGGEPIEYVLRKPLSRSDVTKALNYLSKKLKEAGSNVADSTRTSVHVHLNCQALSMKQIIQLWCLYVVFEELLVNFSGPDREGNLFCLRAKDAEHAVQTLEQGLKTESYNDIFSESLRYTSCNTASLSKFGSLEFRSMRGTVDQGLIQLWIDILCLLKDKAIEYDNPQAIVREFESIGPQAFLYKILGSRQDVVDIFVDHPYRNQKMWDGLRLMRDVAYAIKWEKALPREKKDPPEEVGEFDPIWVANGIYLQYSEQLGNRWYLCNWLNNRKTVYVAGMGCPIDSKRAIPINKDTGQYQNGDGVQRYMIPYHDLYNPESPDDQSQDQVIPVEDDEEITFIETEEEHDDEF